MDQTAPEFYPPNRPAHRKRDVVLAPTRPKQGTLPRKPQHLDRRTSSPSSRSRMPCMARRWREYRDWLNRVGLVFLEFAPCFAQLDWATQHLNEQARPGASKSLTRPEQRSGDGLPDQVRQSVRGDHGKTGMIVNQPIGKFDRNSETFAKRFANVLAVFSARSIFLPAFSVF